MAKIIVHHDTDPGIGIILEPAPHGIEGWYGKCTECGRSIYQWSQERAIERARRHVDNHDAVLVGGDTDALVRG
jgi:hypothetical protein